MFFPTAALPPGSIETRGCRRWDTCGGARSTRRDRVPTRYREQSGDCPQFLRFCWRAWGGILHFVERPWKAVEVMDGSRMSDAITCEPGVTQCAETTQTALGLGKRRARPEPSVFGKRVVLNGVHRRAVADEQDWHLLQWSLALSKKRHGAGLTPRRRAGLEKGAACSRAALAA